MIETETEWIVTVSATRTISPNSARRGKSEIYRKASLKAAMRDAYRKMRRFIMATKRLTEDEAVR